MRSRHFAFLASLVVAAGLAACGCRIFERKPDYPKWRDRVELFAGIEKLAVVPIRESRDIEWPKEFGAEQFNTIFADELVRRARFKVVYPRDVMAGVERANRDMVARCRAEGRAPNAEEIVDPTRSEEDAVAAGRAVGAEAVLVITVNDLEVYPPKRLAIGARVYLCAAPTREAWDVIRMSEAGVPLEVPVALRESFIWERQKHYDSLRKTAQTGMEWYSWRHSDKTGYGDEIFYYSTERFLGFVADDLCASLCDDAMKYKRRSWFKKAPAPEFDAKGVGPDVSGESGFEQGHAERGTRIQPAD